AVEADGVVVGSALVAALGQAPNATAAAETAQAFLTPLRRALDAA
ncbi:MAG: tryptophan synthase subunit alpha, partial [Stenotrophomonas maltophilia]